ncbi:MAG: hypothetical protein IT259_01870 [Saprospiraceae bacterium]|nr:hypothetical protein [Saprospiraceae bacterium]
MQQSDIDRLLRERLHNAEVAPPAFVWPNVERELRRRRRRILFFWLTGASVLLGAAVLYWSLIPQGPEAPLAQTGQPTEFQTPVLRPAASMPWATAENQATENPSHAAAPDRDEAAAASQSSGLARPAKSTAYSRAATTQPIPPAVAPLLPAAVPATATPAVPVSDGAEESTPPVATAPPLARLPFSPAALSEQYSLPAIAPPPPSKKRRARRNCYDFEKKPNVWMIDAYAGPSLARKTLRADADNQPYLNRRFDTERRDWAYNAGIRASWLFNKNFLVRSGLHYDQFTEVFEYVNPDDIRYLVEYRTEIVNGQPVTIADTLDVDFGESYVKTFNRFGLLDIPLVAGVEWRQGNGGVALNAGVSVNVLFWKQGKIMAPGADIPASFTPADESLDVFRTRVGLSATGSAQFFYHLRPTLRVFAEPYYRHILKPVNQASHPVEQRYGIGGVRFGVTKILD